MRRLVSKCNSSSALTYWCMLAGHIHGQEAVFREIMIIVLLLPLLHLSSQGKPYLVVASHKKELQVPKTEKLCQQ